MKLLIVTFALLAAIITTTAQADCKCICVSGKITEVCENSWDTGGGYCSGGYCSDSRGRPNMRMGMDNNDDSGFNISKPYSNPYDY